MRRAALHFIILLVAGAALSGCAVVQVGVTNPIPGLTTVAIAPFFNQSNERAVDGRRFAAGYYTELQKVPGFQVVPNDVTERAILVNRLQMNGPEDALQLAKILNVDAIVVGSITEYTPYTPTRLGMQVSWYSPYCWEFFPGLQDDVFARRRFNFENEDHCDDDYPEHPGEEMGCERVHRFGRKIHRAAEHTFDGIRGQSPDAEASSNRPVSLPEGEKKPPAAAPVNSTAPAANPVIAPSTSSVPAPSVPTTPTSQTGATPANGQCSPNQCPPCEDENFGAQLMALPSEGAALIVGGVDGLWLGCKHTVRSLFHHDDDCCQPANPNAAKPTRTDLNVAPPAYPQPLPQPQCDPLKPFMSYTRIFDGADADLQATLRDYLEVRGDPRSGGWEGHLNRSEDFIRFTAHVMIVEMLTLHGGEGKRRIIFTHRKYQ